MQSNIQQLHDQLVGVWIPTRNRVRPRLPWPRLVLDGQVGHFEDGDFPATYSVDHFSYRLLAPTVLEITGSSQEYLNDQCNGTIQAESWVVPRLYDIIFHQFDNNLFLDVELNPGGRVLTHYFKTTETITSGYITPWRFR